MSYETLLFDVADEVATVTLNRPDRLNAWNDTMGRELAEVMGRCDADEGVRAVVLTGAGKAFCAGADLGTGGDTFAARRREPERAARPRPDGPYGSGPYPFQIRKPVLAALNGHAIGVGITYPMTCDVRIVAEDAKVQFAFVQRGVLPELWSHAIVPRVAGLSNAADVLLSGRVFLGREMAELGLASAALPAAEVLPATLERARELRMAAPGSVALSKRLLWEGLGIDFDAFGRREAKLFAWTTQQPDAREGVVAFLERRRPEWKVRAASDLPEG